MNRKTEDDYRGLYRIGRPPVWMKPHNDVSWQKIARCMAARGGVVSYDELSVVVKGHQHGSAHGTYPGQFVQYCIRMGWLERVK